MLANGNRIGGYTIERHLGSGGMADVYLAHHPRLPRQEVIKVLKTTVAAADEAKSRFLREADLVAGLEHPNIVAVYDRGIDNGIMYIAMPYVPGTDLGKELATATTGIDPNRAVSIALEVASALDYAHNKGLVHRDVKPGNILLKAGSDDGEERALVADFGIARAVGDEVSDLTKPATVVGSIPFSSPEQLLGHTLDGRSDQYSFACTIFFMLTGRRPFIGDTQSAIIGKHLTDARPMVNDINPRMSEVVSQVVARGMAIKPEERWPSCTAFARAFSEAIEKHTPGLDNGPKALGYQQQQATPPTTQLPSSAAQIPPSRGLPPGGRTTIAPQTTAYHAPRPGLTPTGVAALKTAPPKSRRKTWVLTAAALATVLAISIGGWALTRGSESTSTEWDGDMGIPVAIANVSCDKSGLEALSVINTAGQHDETAKAALETALNQNGGSSYLYLPKSCPNLASQLGLPDGEKALVVYKKVGQGIQATCEYHWQNAGHKTLVITDSHSEKVATWCDK